MNRREVLQFGMVSGTSLLSGCQLLDRSESHVEIWIYTNRDEEETLYLEISNTDEKTVFTQLLDVPPSEEDRRHPFDSDEWFRPTTTLIGHFELGAEYTVRANIVDGESYTDTVGVHCTAAEGGGVWTIRLESNNGILIRDSEVCDSDPRSD